MDENERIALAVLETNAKNTVTNLGRVEDKVDAGFLRLDTRIDYLDKKFDGKFDAVNAGIDRLKDWSIGFGIMLMAAIVSSYLLLYG